MMNEIEWELLIDLREKLQAARHGEKGPLIAAACARLGCDEKTVYRKLAEAGGTTKRKVRSDKGNTVYTRRHLMLISGMLTETTRRNGKQLLTVEDAIELAHANGHLPEKLSASRVAQLLREHMLHPEQLSAPSAATALRSLHPNHCWQIDASVCVLFYIKGKGLQSMPAEEFYKNKPENLVRVVSHLCVRYACTDHTSGTVWARYYTGGETTANLIEFFLWCVSQREGCPAHGVPFMVMLDPGAANKSHAFKNLCDRLKVHLQINKPGNPRAKGQVEQSHNVIERHFEGTLRFMPELDLDGLNERCERWQAAFNASRTHSRTGLPRYSVWMTIKPEQLRIAPPLELMRELVTTVEETRRVSNQGTISYAIKGYGTNDYRVTDLPGAAVGQKLTVCVNPYRAPAVDVRCIDPETGEVYWTCVEPVARDEYNFVADAPVIGQAYRAQPHSVADKARNEIAQEAYQVKTLEEVATARKERHQVYAGVIDGMAAIDATPVPAYLPRRGVALETEVRAVASAPISVYDACMRIKAIAGAAYDKKAYAWVAERFPDGLVPADQVETLAQQLGYLAPTGEALRMEDADLRTVDAEPPRLRVVGGVR